MFRNRLDAGAKLAERLAEYKDKNGVVLAIPRGGVPLGQVIARQLDWPLEMVLSKKIAHPDQREYAIGAVSLYTRVLNDTIDVPERYIDFETKRLRNILKEKYQWYFKYNPNVSYTDKFVIIVDDGMATGYTMLSTIQLIKEHKPKTILIAVPAASIEAVDMIKRVPGVYEVVCLKMEEGFFAVGQYYEDFRPVNDQEVKDIISGKKELVEKK